MFEHRKAKDLIPNSIKKISKKNIFKLIYGIYLEWVGRDSDIVPNIFENETQSKIFGFYWDSN